MRGHPSYRRQRSFVQAILIVLLAMFLSLSFARDIFGLRSLLVSVVYPFQYATVSVWKGVAGVPSAVVNLRGLADKNRVLEKELKELKPQLVTLKALESDNNHLRAALGFAQYRSGNLIPARVIARAPSAWFSIIEVNKGRRSGVRVDRPVVTKDGLVGRVIEVADHTAKVLLILDADSSISAVDGRSRDIGAVTGTTSTKLVFRYVTSGADIKLDDLIVTSQSSSLFPPNIPLGRVVRVAKAEHDMFYQIELVPSVNFHRLEEVYVAL